MITINYCKPQNASGRNHDLLMSRWWHFCLLSTNGNFPFLEKRGIHFFSKDVYSPSIYLGPHLPSQVFRFELASTSLTILYVFNDGIKIRENRGLWTASLRKISNEELWQCTRQKTSEVDECFKLGTDWLLTQNKDQETSKGPHFNFTYKKIKPISTPLPQCKSHHTMKTKKS